MHRHRLLGLVFTLLAMLVALPAAAEGELRIGYLELDGDTRYRDKHTFARYLTQPLGRPFPAAEVALREARFPLKAVNLSLELERASATDAAGLVEKLRAMRAAGTHFFLVDAPSATLAELAAATRGDDVLLLNISAADDRLRGEACQANLLHVLPSHAMASDALAQFLVSKKWREVLVLYGGDEEDKRLRDAFEHTAERFGLDIDESRQFVLGNDPRQRDSNNIRLLTVGADYDVVFVADTDGEFARALPYNTADPRPIIGSEGLAALAWHWSWDRHGAPQLEGRFQKKAKRPMRGVDWAAWMAVKSLTEAAVRTGSADPATVENYLRGTDIVIDGFKGNRLSFRPWDGQLRQPMLLATHNWVVARAPLRGFLHPTNNLDTLGTDERDTLCKP